MENAKKNQTKVPALRRGRFQHFEPSAEHSDPPDITAPSSPKSFKCFPCLMVDWCRPLGGLAKDQPSTEDFQPTALIFRHGPHGKFRHSRNPGGAINESG